jgi:hypothetical protein
MSNRLTWCGVQCEFLFRLRTETRSVLEDERKIRGSRVEMPRAPEAPVLPCLASTSKQRSQSIGLDSSQTP